VHRGVALAHRIDQGRLRSASAGSTMATSTRPSESASLSAARIGAAVSTGEAMRTRRRAAPMRFAMRCDSSGPRPGENHARTATPPTSTGGRSNAPLPSTRPAAPQVLEIARVCARELLRVDRDEHLLLGGLGAVAERALLDHARAGSASSAERRSSTSW